MPSTKKTVLGIDPGGKGGDTGVVFISYSDTQPATLVDSVAVHDGFDGFCEWWSDFTRRNEIPDTVVVETFVNYGRPGADLSPLLIEGVVRYFYPEAVLSPASGKNKSVPDAVLKRLGVYMPGDHHRDRTEAARHVVRWLRNQNHIPTLRAGWPQ